MYIVAVILQHQASAVAPVSAVDALAVLGEIVPSAVGTVALDLILGKCRTP